MHGLQVTFSEPCPPTPTKSQPVQTLDPPSQIPNDNISPPNSTHPVLPGLPPIVTLKSPSPNHQPLTPHSLFSSNPQRATHP
eukprot:1500047-Rhodomonas_salina.2